MRDRPVHLPSGQRLLKAALLPSDSLLKLKNLMAFCDRLVKTKTSLKNTIGGLRDISYLIDNTLNAAGTNRVER